MRAGIYIHVPFCVRKCRYCDFYSLPVAGAAGQVDAFVQAVCREMALAAERHASLATFEALTLFLGGGTPSLLTPDHVERLLACVHRYFLLRPDAEITVESNPETLDAEKASRYRALGINRISLGAQAFEDRLLRALGREHTAAQILDAARVLRRAGFANLNLDLMFALPGQTLEDWRETLRQAVALAPEHVSAYSLTIEPGTPFAEWERQGRLQRPDEDLEAAMLEAAMDLLPAAGYEHYEISNFARPGFRCAHNQIYWRNEPYLGFGPAAVSYVGGERCANVRSLSHYLAALEEGELPVASTERLEGRAEMGETMMVGLRLLEGVEHARFADRFGVTPPEAYPEPIRRLTRSGLLQVDERRLVLTRRGVLLANEVAVEFLA